MQYSELKTAIQDYCQNSEETFVAHINDFIIAAEDKIFSVVSMPAFWKSDLNQVCADGTAEYTLDAGVMDIFSVRISEGTSSQSTSGVQFGPSRYLIQKDYDFLLEAYPGSTSGTSATLTTPGISEATEAVVTATNTFANDDLVYIDGVVGMTEVNGNFYRVSDRSDANFKIKSGGSYVNTTEGYTTWSSGGTATSGVDTSTPKYYAVSSSGVSSSNPTMTIRLGPIPNAAYPMTVDYYGKVAADSITYDPEGVDVPDANKTWISVTFPDVLLYGALVEAYIFMKGEQDILQSYQMRFNEGLSMVKNFGEGRQASDNSGGSGAAPGPVAG